MSHAVPNEIPGELPQGSNEEKPLPPGSTGQSTGQNGSSSTNGAVNKAVAKGVLVNKRDGSSVEFDGSRIQIALQKAFKADRGANSEGQLDAFSDREAQTIADEVIAKAIEHGQRAGLLEIEQIQDIVEMLLMQRGHYSVARRYIVYREEHAKARSLRQPGADLDSPPILVTQNDGSSRPLDWEPASKKIKLACDELDQTSADKLEEEVARSLYNYISESELDRALILAARTKIEQDPEYQTVAARLLLDIIYKEVLDINYGDQFLEQTYREKFSNYVREGIAAERLSPNLLLFDLDTIARAIKPERDELFLYIGLQTIYDRYLIHIDNRKIETPQFFWMRVAMGLASKEPVDKEQRAIEFYNLLSSHRFISSTPTLFNSGTPHPQLSSCYLTTVGDDLEHIFKCISDNAKLSKWAGGLGNDWTAVRATGARIKGTNGESQGVIPFLKVANDTAIAVNQGGKRKGAMCAYLETWHLEMEEFLELRKNTGDDRRRTHDMNTANWIPDLFMKRVLEDGVWTLLSPNEAADLHDLYGKEFEERYVQYEKLAAEGKLKQFKQVQAGELWRKMLSMLFETGHPWITFKDPSNIRSPQDHAGVVHSSNLCTEILLNTSREETAVCNLGSVNLVKHIKNGKLDKALLRETVKTALRMLDNVIDINFYPTEEAKTSNHRHRPVGLGVMAFQDALYELGVSYASNEAIQFADESMELISYHAILASAELAGERGAYSSYKGSKWSRGLFPIDTIDLLAEQRGGDLVAMDKSTTLDWQPVRDTVAKNGMRNSNVIAIAPTATIANIAGVSQSIEPTFRNLFVKSNLSGEFTVVNPYLVKDLKALDLWNQEMIDDLKYHDGIVADIDCIPDELKGRYITAFEIDQSWLIECASRRQKWIDMGQSLNLYIGKPSGRLLDEMYKFAWQRGLKTTYYLRSLSATTVEKSSIDVNSKGIQPKWMKSKSASSEINLTRQEEATSSVCSLDDPECEACQ